MLRDRIARRLRMLLSLRNISQAEVAREVGVSKTTINALCTGNERYGLSLQIIDKIAKYIGVPLEHLISEAKVGFDLDDDNQVQVFYCREGEIR